MSMEDIPQEVIDQWVDQYLAEQSGEEPMLTGEQSNFFGMMPQYNPEGDPYDLTKQLNQFQDVNQVIADPVFQGLSGPGAFGARAFQPRVRMEVVESPEYVRWQNYLNSPDSFEGMVAAELEGGGTPSSAIRKIRAKALENPEGALAQELQALFPAEDRAGIIPGETNWGMISQAATEIDVMRGKIPQIGNAGFTMEDGTVVGGGGEIMEIMGPNGPQLVRRTEEPTELMEKYDQLGLPYPTEQYTPEGILGPDWTAASEQFQMGQGNVDALTQASEAAYRKYLNYQEPRVGAATEEAGTTTNDNGYDVLSSAQQNVLEQPGPTGAELDMIEATRERALANGPPTPSILDPQVIPPLADQLIAEGHELPPHWTYTINPDGTIGPALPEEYQAGGTHGYEEPVSTPDVNEPDKPLTMENAATDDDVYNRWMDEVYPTLDTDDQQASLRYFDEVDVATDAGRALPRPPTLASAPPPAQGFMGTPALGPNGQLPAGASSYSVGRGDFSQAQTDAMMRRLLTQQGGEPVPPGGELAGPPAPGRTQPGPFPAEEQAGTYRNTWGPTDNPFTAFGLNQEYVPPGGDLPPYAQPGAQPARQPGDASYIAERSGIPPVTIAGNPNPAYQDYLDMIALQRRGTPAPVPPPVSLAAATAQLRPRGGGPPLSEQPGRGVNARNPMTNAMIAQIIGGGAAPQRTGERPQEEERYDPLSSATTGEHVRRTAEDRRALAERNAPRGLQGEEGNILGTADPREQLRGGWMAAYRRRSHELVARQAEREQLYGAAFGQAVRAYVDAQRTGATPTNQVYAQRVQNIQNAGIPLQANPRVMQV